MISATVYHLARNCYYTNFIFHRDVKNGIFMTSNQRTRLWPRFAAVLLPAGGEKKGKREDHSGEKN